jgi:uncharacterized protein YjgD (DUF1641 family)
MPAATPPPHPMLSDREKLELTEVVQAAVIPLMDQLRDMIVEDVASGMNLMMGMLADLMNKQTDTRLRQLTRERIERIQKEMKERPKVGFTT